MKLSRNEISKNIAEAIKSGADGYWGNPCRRGHSGWRKLKPNGTGFCVDCNSDQNRKWRNANVEYNKERRKKWYSENDEHAKRYAKMWAEDNKDRVRLKNKEWSDRNKHKKASLNKQWMLRNSDKRRDYMAEYKKSRRSDLTSHENARRARKMAAAPSWANSKEIKWIYRHASLLNCWGGPRAQVDHIVPLTSDLVCGLHCEQNLQILWSHENQSKGNHHWPDMPEAENDRNNAI